MERNIKWSPYAQSKIKKMQEIILRKKILMSIAVDVYSSYDKWMKYILLIVAGLPVLLGIISNILQRVEELNDTKSSGGTIIDIIIIILNAVVLGLIKLKDALKYDKTKDTSKEQSIKYYQLYEKIEKDYHENDMKEGDFLYWMSREYSLIETNDPEISNNVKNKFIKKCRLMQVPYDDDATLLINLINGAESPHGEIRYITDDESKSSLENAINYNNTYKNQYNEYKFAYNNNVGLEWASNMLKSKQRRYDSA